MQKDMFLMNQLEKLYPAFIDSAPKLPFWVPTQEQTKNKPPRTGITQILNTPPLSLGWSAFEQDAEPEAT
jgi:hypothetical protein